MWEVEPDNITEILYVSNIVWFFSSSLELYYRMLGSAAMTQG